MRNEEQGSHFGGAPRSGERVDPEVPEPAGETSEAKPRPSPSPTVPPPPKWEANLGSPSGRAPRSGERADPEVHSKNIAKRADESDN